MIMFETFVYSRTQRWPQFVFVNCSMNLSYCYDYQKKCVFNYRKKLILSLIWQVFREDESEKSSTEIKHSTVNIEQVTEIT